MNSNEKMILQYLVRQNREEILKFFRNLILVVRKWEKTYPPITPNDTLKTASKMLSKYYKRQNKTKRK